MPLRAPRNLGHMLFGFWLVAMGITQSPLNLTFQGIWVILGLLLIAAGICMLLDI